MKIFMFLIILIFFLIETKCQRKIFGGETATRGTFGHIVYLRMPRAACTGCIIHEEWVLTAAHCVCNNPDDIMIPNDLKIVAGSIDIETLDKGAQIRKGKEIYVHENYRLQLGKPDLAVVRVNAVFKFDASVQKIGFNTSPWPQNDKNIWNDCVSAGWGLTGGGQTTELMYLNTSARHGKNSCPCVEKYYILKRYVCLPNRAEGICFGDSGGALVCSNKIVGVAHIIIDKRSCSFTTKPDKKINCGSKNVYGIYIYTCPFLDWISTYVPGVPGTPESCSGKRLSLSIADKKIYIPFYIIIKHILYKYFQ